MAPLVESSGGLFSYVKSTGAHGPFKRRRPMAGLRGVHYREEKKGGKEREEKKEEKKEEE